MPDIYDALAAPARRAILDALAERAEQTLFELVNRLSSDPATALTRQAVSQHLQVLEDAGLVERRRQGRYVLHTLTPEPLRDISRRWLPDSQEQS
ncbi:helix-turn-helix transcriptional regulator [uncultured Demequina sp.]|uniref:ArsR/SmtB family transcription factor n=1 Tax=uncultured Demequina sp. TaxID=693499 RepID=UPI0025DAF632|nr:metalloregulator ArsR/SmtB family transcription factor [uncultured Demequina sp.]